MDGVDGTYGDVKVGSNLDTTSKVLPTVIGVKKLPPVGDDEPTAALVGKTKLIITLDADTGNPNNAVKAFKRALYYM